MNLAKVRPKVSTYWLRDALLNDEQNRLSLTFMYRDSLLCIVRQTSLVVPNVHSSGWPKVRYLPSSSCLLLNRRTAFAALPKLEDEPNILATPRPSPSTEELLKNIQLPARPEDMTEDSEVAALEKQFQKMNGSIEELSRPPSPSTPRPEPLIGTKISNDLRKFHANFESRLQPFWSSVLPGRTISIQLFPKPLDATEDPTAHGPIASTYVQTAPDGSFQARVRVRWEEMCQHPGALHIAFGQASLEHEVLAQAYLLPTTSPPPSPTDETPPGPPPVTSARIPLTHSPIRVISDIDDTIKHADVLGGARSVFYNVFVRELSDLIIPGMGEWYTKMWNRGVRFHYIVRF